MAPTNRKAAPKKTSKPPYMIPPRHPQLVPPFIVKSVASVFCVAMGHILDEVATRIPRSTVIRRNTYQLDLSAMCLVSKRWAKESKQFLNRRVFIPSVLSMQSYLRHNRQGGTTLELWYVHTTDDAHYKNENAQIHWCLLAKLLAAMPNLRFLAIDVRDFPEDDSDADDESHSEPPPKSTKSAVQSNKPARLSKDDQEDKRRSEEVEVDFTGIRDAIRAMGSLVHLSGLELLSDYFSLQRDRRVQRYCPYFVDICEQLPNMPRLKYLRIRGFSSHQDEEGTRYSEKRLIGKSPPRSLKTLVLELPSWRIPYSAVGWLLTSQQSLSYAPENLLIKFAEDPGFMAFPSLCNDIRTTKMRNFRLEYSDEGLLSTPLFAAEVLRKAVATSFLDDTPALRSLHMPSFFFNDDVADTAEDLAVLFEYAMEGEYGDESERAIWRSRDKELASMLSRLNFPPLVKGVTIGVSNEEDICGAPGQDDMESWLPRTERYCEKKNINIQMVEDLPLEKRMATFLRFGKIEYPLLIDEDRGSIDSEFE